METIFDYISSQRWFFGVRAEETLFFYSAKSLNRAKLIRKYYHSSFVETLLFPVQADYPVRVFNLAQAKKFHQESLNKITAKPQVLLRFIELDKKNWQRIEKISSQLLGQVKLKNFKKSHSCFLQLLNLYAQYGNLFFIIFSLGMVMTKNKASLKHKVESILHKHDQWRNSVAFKEEKLGKAIYLFIKLLAKELHLKVSPQELLKYLSAQEVIDFLNKEISSQALTRIIKKRKESGYIFASLHSKNVPEVIDDANKIRQIKKYFLQLQEPANEKLTGMIAYSNKQRVKGTVVVIKDKNELAHNKINLVGKILVAIQTTPHFIPYLKKVKAIITDEGGVTCHAAIVAREFKIPCLVGTKNSTKVLKTGDSVILDMKQGFINKK